MPSPTDQALLTHALAGMDLISRSGEERPAIPLRLDREMSDLEFALFYIAQKDRSEQARAARRGPAGVSWGGMQDYSDRYVPKTYEEMLGEAREQVARRAERRAV